MTIATTNNRVDFVGNSSTDTYGFSFKCFAETDLKVYQDGVLLALTTDYTVTPDTSLDDGPSAGHITLVAGNLGTGVELSIQRSVPSTQDLDLNANDSFPAQSVEDRLDKLTMLVQQLEEAVGRAIKLAASSTESEVGIDDLDGNSGKYLRSNATEDGLEFAAIASSGSLGVPVAVADGGTGQTTADAGLAALQTVEDARTDSVKSKVYKATTSGTPAAGIGAGEKFQAESQDEDPSDVGEHQFVFSDVGAGTEDSYWQLLLRVAGAALTAVYRFVATGAFKAIVTHANTADRTYTLPDLTGTVLLDNTFQMSTSSPAISSSAGSITSATSAARYKQIGKLVFIHLDITITDNGTGSGFVKATLPVAPAGSKNYVLNGRAANTSGKQLQGFINTASSATDVFIANYDNTYPAVTGEILRLTGFYEAA